VRPISVVYSAVANCALLSQPADFDEDEPFDIFNYYFDYDSTIYSGDFLDLY